MDIIGIVIIETIEYNRLKWYGYVQGLEKHHWPRKVLEWIPQTTGWEENSEDHGEMWTLPQKTEATSSLNDDDND